MEICNEVRTQGFCCGKRNVLHTLCTIVNSSGEGVLTTHQQQTKPLRAPTTSRSCPSLPTRSLLLAIAARGQPTASTLLITRRDQSRFFFTPGHRACFGATVRSAYIHGSSCDHRSIFAPGHSQVTATWQQAGLRPHAPRNPLAKRVCEAGQNPLFDATWRRANLAPKTVKRSRRFRTMRFPQFAKYLDPLLAIWITKATLLVRTGLLRSFSGAADLGA